MSRNSTYSIESRRGSTGIEIILPDSMSLNVWTTQEEDVVVSGATLVVALRARVRARLRDVATTIIFWSVQI